MTKQGGAQPGYKWRVALGDLKRLASYAAKGSRAELLRSAETLSYVSFAYVLNRTMESTRWDETWHRLREWTNGQAQSERLAAQILICEGFEGIDPSHPLGGPDGGKDATCRYEDEPWVMAVYFPRGKKRISDIEAKLSADIESAKKHNPAGIAFVTNQELSLSQRARLKKFAPPSRIAIFHLERITSILDAPQMAGVRQQFLGIESIDCPVSTTLACRDNYVGGCPPRN